MNSFRPLPLIQHGVTICQEIQIETSRMKNSASSYLSMDEFSILDDAGRCSVSPTTPKATNVKMIRYIGIYKGCGEQLHLFNFLCNQLYLAGIYDCVHTYNKGNNVGFRTTCYNCYIYVCLNVSCK